MKIDYLLLIDLWANALNCKQQSLLCCNEKETLKRDVIMMCTMEGPEGSFLVGVPGSQKF